MLALSDLTGIWHKRDVPRSCCRSATPRANDTPSTVQDVASPAVVLKVMVVPAVCPAREVARQSAAHAGDPMSAVVISGAPSPTTDVVLRILPPLVPEIILGRASRHPPFDDLSTMKSKRYDADRQRRLDWHEPESSSYDLRERSGVPVELRGRQWD
jgi:hypothetical protein